MCNDGKRISADNSLNVDQIPGQRCHQFIGGIEEILTMSVAFCQQMFISDDESSPCNVKGQAGAQYLKSFSRINSRPGCYIVYPPSDIAYGGAEWFEARNKCFLHGGDLITDVQLLEKSQLSSFATTLELRPDDKYWIGLERDPWVWADTHTG